MIDTILIPLDGSPLAEQGLHTARGLARETGAALLLLTARPFSMLSGADEREKERIALRKTQQYLQRTRQALESQGFTVRVQMMPGNAVSAILFTAEAEADRIGLISMATHGHTGLRHALLGSVAAAVVRESTTPLLLTRAAGRSNPPEVTPYQRILVALDGTPFAETALRFLAAHRLGRAGELMLLRVVTREPIWPLPMGYAGNEAVMFYQQAREVTERDQQEADEYLRSLGAAQLPGWTWKPVVALDDPAAAILEAARTGQADLIVLATHARQGLDRLLHGSVAHEVLKRAEIPVLLLHGPVGAGEAPETDLAAARSTPSESVGEPIAAGQVASSEIPQYSRHLHEREVDPMAGRQSHGAASSSGILY
ncbi:MAG TPA: universal stress protein [Chloroflexota bacterium]|nr:universal stress protein [Chloroflexota bacterium]